MTVTGQPCSSSRTRVTGILALVVTVTLTASVTNCRDTQPAPGTDTPARPDRRLSHSDSPSSPSVDPTSEIRISKIEAHFLPASRGITTIDGALWVPEISIELRNAGPVDLDAIYIRAVFTDDQNVIRGDAAVGSMKELPAGYTKGPLSLHGTVGYTTDMAFLDWTQDKSKRWRFDLFFGSEMRGPWRRVGSGRIDSPWAGNGEFLPDAVGEKTNTPASTTSPANSRLSPSMASITSLATATASSTLPPDLGMTFGPSNLIDGRLETSWQPSAKGSSGVGESISFKFASAHRFARLEIANGYQYDWHGQDLFSMNARIRELKIEIGANALSFTFDDTARGYTSIPIEPPQLGTSIKLTVVSVFQGTRWPDLAVSDIEIFEASPPAVEPPKE